MKWSFEIEGAPPTVNSMYKRIIVRQGGKPRPSVMKHQKVADYQLLVTYRTREAKPSGWVWPGNQIRIYYDFFLKRDADADNLLKALNDAIAIALDVNDKVFIPCVRTKQPDPKPRVIVEIDDGAE